MLNQHYHPAKRFLMKTISTALALTILLSMVLVGNVFAVYLYALVEHLDKRGGEHSRFIALAREIIKVRRKRYRYLGADVMYLTGGLEARQPVHLIIKYDDIKLIKSLPESDKFVAGRENRTFIIRSALRQERFNKPFLVLKKYAVVITQGNPEHQLIIPLHYKRPST